MYTRFYKHVFFATFKTTMTNNIITLKHRKSQKNYCRIQQTIKTHEENTMRTIPLTSKQRN